MGVALGRRRLAAAQVTAGRLQSGREPGGAAVLQGTQGAAGTAAETSAAAAATGATEGRPGQAEAPAGPEEEPQPPQPPASGVTAGTQTQHFLCFCVFPVIFLSKLSSQNSGAARWTCGQQAVSICP